MWLLKHVLESCFSPEGVITLFLIAGLFLSLRRERWQASRRSFVMGSLLFLVVFCAPTGEILIGKLEQQYPPLSIPEAIPEATKIVVLSAYGVENSTTPITSNLSEETIYRLVEGMRVYRRVPRAKLIVAGGVVRQHEKSLADLMAEFLLALGVPKEDVLVENQSMDSFENLRNVQPLVGTKPFFLVTSAYHLRRTMAIAQRLGMNPIACPAFINTLQFHPAGRSWPGWIWDILKSFSFPSSNRLILIQRSFHEYVGFGWYQMTGKI